MNIFTYYKICLTLYLIFKVRLSKPNTLKEDISIIIITTCIPVCLCFSDWLSRPNLAMDLRMSKGAAIVGKQKMKSQRDERVKNISKSSFL